MKTPEDGVQYVKDRVPEGVSYIKLFHESGLVMGKTWPKHSLAVQSAVIEEAHKYGLPVVAHATCLVDTIEILNLGIDGMAHTFIDQPPSAELIAAYEKYNAHCNPTLSAMGSGTAECVAMQEKFAHDPRIQHLIGKMQRERMCECMAYAKAQGATCENAFESVRQLKAAGIKILW